MDLRVGSRIKTYDRDLEIKDVLGSGGFGIVFRAEDENANPFAVKTISTASLDEAQLTALRNEAERALEIQHPNVLRVRYFHDGRTYPDLPPYMVCDFADGGTLEQLLASQTAFLPLDEMLAFFAQLIDGMEAVNARLVHRDIKPENVLLDGGRLKIADFGLSKIVGAATRSSDATFKGFGTLAYCAPEAFLLEANTPAMDMYSMGIVFYRLATLRHPYTVSVADPFAWREAHMGQQAADPRTHNRDLPLAVVQTIIKMIAKRPADRFQSWSEVRQSLAAATVIESAHDPSVAALVERVMSRHQAQEAVRVAEETAKSEAQQTFDRVAYAFSELERDVRAVVDTFNAQSQFGKLDIIAPASGGGDFSLEIHTDAGPKKGWEADRVILDVMLSRDRWKLSYDSRAVLAAGGFSSTRTQRGVNLLLLSEGADDLYGRWYTLRSRRNPLVESDTSIPDPRAFSAAELDTEILYVGVSLYKYDMKLKPWDKSVVTEVVSFIL